MYTPSPAAFPYARDKDKTLMALHQSVLSTTFFSYDGSVFAISSWWWILPLTAAPLTGLVMFLWFWWFRQRLSRDHATLQTRRHVAEDSESRSSLAGRK